MTQTPTYDRNQIVKGYALKSLDSRQIKYEIFQSKSSSVLSKGIKAVLYGAVLLTIEL
jgi:hypothetical protein